jgi:hypothetical protein
VVALAAPLALAWPWEQLLVAGGLAAAAAARRQQQQLEAVAALALGACQQHLWAAAVVGQHQPRVTLLLEAAARQLAVQLAAAPKRGAWQQLLQAMVPLVMPAWQQQLWAAVQVAVVAVVAEQPQLLVLGVAAGLLGVVGAAGAVWRQQRALVVAPCQQELWATSGVAGAARQPQVQAAVVAVAAAAMAAVAVATAVAPALVDSCASMWCCLLAVCLMCSSRAQQQG